ncbi:helix-turn-helix domain-containing protein [soil metagenome]
MEEPNLLDTADCRRVTDTLAKVGDKWSVLLVMELEAGPRRFAELHRAISGISHKMLALTLRGLERDGFLTRTVYPTKPPSVEYALSALGHEIVVPVKALGAWVFMNLHRIEDARDRFDAAL